jgi:hypothetical protein
MKMMVENIMMMIINLVVVVVMIEIVIMVHHDVIKIQIVQANIIILNEVENKN